VCSSYRFLMKRLRLSSRTGPRFFLTRPSQAMPSYYKESFVWCQKVQDLNTVQKSCPSALLEPTLQRAVWLLAPTQDGMGWARASREHRTYHYHLTNSRCKRFASDVFVRPLHHGCVCKCKHTFVRKISSRLRNPNRH